jgi:hypothetical protein
MKVMKTETYTIELTGTEKAEIMDALYEVLERLADMNLSSNLFNLHVLKEALRSA